MRARHRSGGRVSHSTGGRARHSAGGRARHSADGHTRHSAGGRERRSAGGRARHSATYDFWAISVLARKRRQQQHHPGIISAWQWRARARSVPERPALALRWHTPLQREQARVGPRARLHRALQCHPRAAFDLPGSTVHVVLCCTRPHITRRVPAATGGRACGVAPRAL